MGVFLNFRLKRKRQMLQGGDTREAGGGGNKEGEEKGMMKGSTARMEENSDST
jgi:hypothetical protein